MIIPVILFAYARPKHLARVLGCLRENEVPLLHVYADAAKDTGEAAAVAEVRVMLRAIDWCEVRLTERPENLGLGRNVLAGITEVAAQHDAFIVWEDDLICVPGTYEWVSAALRQFTSNERVMSVSAWTHPRVTPRNVVDQPYFDARADCWVWGSYARSWRGMNNETALDKIAALESTGASADFYGSDLPMQARDELRKNIWAVRWLYHHFQHEGLCLRPPWSMVEHIGFDEATNAGGATDWINPPLQRTPKVPARWPEVIAHEACQRLWQQACPRPSLASRARQALGSILVRWKGAR